jgi:hypothetical protein
MAHAPRVYIDPTRGVVFIRAWDVLTDREDPT